MYAHVIKKDNSKPKVINFPFLSFLSHLDPEEPKLVFWKTERRSSSLLIPKTETVLSGRRHRLTEPGDGGGGKRKLSPDCLIGKN